MSIDPVWWIIALFISVIINLGLIICFLYTRLDKAEALLYDVRFICWYKNTFGTSLPGRQARMNALSMVVFLPGLLEKRGEMSREAYLRLPTSLIKQIRALYIFLCANALAMAGLYFFVCE